MANKRVFYAIQYAGVAPLGSATYTSIRGLQNFTCNTTFNLQQIFEFGQSAIYENVEGIPNIEGTLSKVLDGFAPIYTLATQAAGGPGLLARANCNACQLAMSIFSDQQLACSGTAINSVIMSGMYVSQVAYRITVDGPATEEVSMVGNNKLWTASAPTINDTAGGAGSIVTDDDSPLAITGSGGVNMKEDFRLGDGMSRLPTEMPGVGTSGWIIAGGDGVYPVHLRSFSATANLNREDIFELGRKGNYYRYVRIPAEVTSEIGIISISGDMISAMEEGTYAVGGTCGRYNLLDQTIYIRMCEGLQIDLGTKNKLQSVNWNGGGVDGANQELVYTYRNFNDFIVYHPQDPNAALDAFIPVGGF